VFFTRVSQTLKIQEAHREKTVDTLKNKSSAKIKKGFLTLILLLSVILPTFAQSCNAQTSTLENKATLFLTDVLKLDLSQYKLTINPEFTDRNNGHLFYNLDAGEGIFSSDGNLIINFYNGTLGSCSINPGIAGIAYTTPFVDRFNTTLGILERYQAWTNDPQVQQMVELLRKVGQERIGLQVDGNLSLRISTFQSGLGIYRFSNYLNGVEYTYLSIAMKNQTYGDFDFSVNRVFQKIGDTRINVSTTQAIAIAQDAVERYSYNHSFGNGTSVIVSNFNVTGVYDIGISSQIKGGNTLYPLYDVKLNVTGLPSKATGLGVFIWANDGTVQSVYHYIYPGDADFTSLMTDIIFFPMMMSTITSLLTFVGILVVVVVVLWVALKKNNTAKVN
jgi:hypothetical protein